MLHGYASRFPMDIASAPSCQYIGASKRRKLLAIICMHGPIVCPHLESHGNTRDWLHPQYQVGTVDTAIILGILSTQEDSTLRAPLMLGVGFCCTPSVDTSHRDVSRCSARVLSLCNLKADQIMLGQSQYHESLIICNRLQQLALAL